MMVKTLLLSILSLLCTVASAQTWTDVTDFYITNSRYDNGSTNGWEGNEPTNKTDGAIAYMNLSFYYYYLYAYQSTPTLTKGHYRLSFKGFYRMGSATDDYKLYSSGNYSDSQNAKVYAIVGDQYKFVKLPAASSGASETSLSSTASKLSNGKYIPNNVESATQWFNAGYYNNVIEFDASDANNLLIELENYPLIQNQMLCLGPWKLEKEGELQPVTQIYTYINNVLSSEMSIVPTMTQTIYYSCSPTDATVKRVTFTSSNPDVATVGEDGTVTGISVGEATITVKAIDGSGTYADVKVHVNQPALATGGNVIINEIMAANIDQKLDPSFNYGSWMELYNPTSDIITLDGLYVTDDLSDLKKCAVKNKQNFIKNNGYTCVWFDHYDPTFSPQQITFKLDYDGDTIYVTDGTKVLASQAYPQAIGRMSYARVTDGADTWRWTSVPTPEASNSGNGGYADEQAEAPEIVEDGCVYTNDTTIHVTVPDGEYVVLTTDGSVPQASSNDKFTKSFTINISQKNLPLRVRAFRDGYLPSEVVTRNFIYRDKSYVFPIIALTADYEDIYGGDHGILVRGYGNGRRGNGQNSYCNWNAEWDRPVNFEYIKANGEYALNQEVDMASCGGWSRAYSPHSFKLKASKYYLGKNTLDCQFFDTKPYDRHKCLQIRNGGNDTGGRIKDVCIQQILSTSGWNINTQAWQPVHVFINGAYSSTINMREPNNKHYAYSNYGIDTDNIDQFEMSPDSGYVQKEGTIDKYLEWYDLSADAANPDTYSKICDMVDIEQYANYMATEFYIANWDWPQNNVKGFRSRDDGKFRFTVFDTEQFNGVSGSPFTTFANKKNYTFDSLYGDDSTPWKDGDKNKEEIKFVTIFLNMLQNDEFRKLFIDAYCMANGSVFMPIRVQTVVNDVNKYMNSGLALDDLNCTSSSSSVTSFFSTTNQTTKISYLKNYTNMQLKGVSSSNLYLSSNIEDGELFFNGHKIPTGQFSGTVFRPAVIRAAAPEGYIFKGWSTFKNTDIINTNIEIELSKSSERYVANWEKMTDEQMIANNINPAKVVINEVSASNSVYVSDYFKKADWMELYNNSDSTVNIAGMYVSDNVEKPTKYQIPADNPLLNTVIPAHGYKLIWCDKKDDKGSEIHASFKLDEEGAVMISNYDGDALVYSDTLTYTAHDGTESYGCYPDGGMAGYVMQRPTPGAANMCYADVYSFIQSQNIVTGIEDVNMSDSSSDIIIASVGSGIVNVKSMNGTLRSVAVYSTTGAMMMNVTPNETFTTINLSDLPQGTYIVKASDNNGSIASLKVALR